MMIPGVEIKQLQKNYEDARGSIMEILRSDDALYSGFGQVYLSTCKPGISKQLHYHNKKTDIFFCIAGKAKLVVYDIREGSPTKGKRAEHVLSTEQPLIIKVPPHVAHGFACTSREEAVILTVTSIPFNQEDSDDYHIEMMA